MLVVQKTWVMVFPARDYPRQWHNGDYRPPHTSGPFLRGGSSRVCTIFGKYAVVDYFAVGLGWATGGDSHSWRVISIIGALDRGRMGGVLVAHPT